MQMKYIQYLFKNKTVFNDFRIFFSRISKSEVKKLLAEHTSIKLRIVQNMPW